MKQAHQQYGRAALGTYALTGAYGQVDATGVIDAFIGLGGRCIDTAALYGNGESERKVGRAIAAHRAKVVICSKGGFWQNPQTGKREVNGRPEQIISDCEQSLTRLGVDVINLYYLHRLDPNVPIEESVGALVQLKEQGKVKAVGLCEVGDKTLARANRITPIDALQSEYSLATREPEAFFGELSKRNCAYFAFSPLSRGLLSSALPAGGFTPDDDRAHLPRFMAPNLAHNLALVEQMGDVARELGLTGAQLALAWCMHKGAIPISGATSPEHVKDIFTASQVQLTNEVLASLERIFSTIAGERYSPEGMRRASAGYT